MDGALILVIEDETLLRENIAEIIGHFGFRVISVPTGEEAIKETLIKSQKLVKYAVDRNHCKGAH